MMRRTRERRASYRFGLLAEWAGMLWLMLRGYRILDRRYRNHGGEIDLIAERFGTLVFVEVKARQEREDGLAAVSDFSRARITRAAEGFIAAHPKYACHHMRFDLMVWAKWRWPVHIENAWLTK